MIYFYFHAGSTNHGCEAIVRASRDLLGNEAITLISDRPEEDRKYGLHQLVTVEGKKRYTYSFAEKVRSFVEARFLKREKYGYELVSKYESQAFCEGSLAMSIGGDNYCYGEAYNWHLAGLNRNLQKRHVKTVLWGCSIEPATVTEEMKMDFAGYDLIVAREEISYQFLKQLNPHVVKACDPAFYLERVDLPLPEAFQPGKTVGINLSPLIQKSESAAGITMQNYQNLLQHILDTTDYYIALIPHVVGEGNDDRLPLKELYDAYASSNRVCLIGDHNCQELKGFIARCDLFIGARTHATIAAYSTHVPTLVVGYSTKATGIARDLFGTEDHYVLPVQKLTKASDLTEAFDWLNDHKAEIREGLEAVMPAYKASMRAAVEAIKELNR